MRTPRIFIICLISAFFLNAFGQKNDEPQLFVKIETQLPNIYVNQSFPFTVTLFSSTPDIAFANRSSSIRLNKGGFDILKRVENAGPAYKKEINGKSYFCFPLESYMASFATKGNYEISEGPYEIGVSFPVIYNDPFWGRMRSSEVKTYNVDVKNCSVKVKSLPNPPSGFSYSGSIGNFTIETVLPKGNIYVNEEAIAYIIIKGKGTISSSSLPEYRSAFENGLTLKSISESRGEYFEQGQLVSELRLECSFIPNESVNIEIGSISFGYFDPFAGKYKTAVSEPVKIDVKSSVNKKEKISI